MLLGLNALFVAAEFSLVTADRAAMRAADDAGARGIRRTLALIGNLSFHVSGTQLGITVTSVLLGFLAEPAVAALMDPLLDEPPRAVSVALALVIATVLQMVLGELVPKQVAIAYANRTARTLTPAIRAYSTVARPAIALCEGAANRLARRLGVEPVDEIGGSRSRDELAVMIRTSGESGSLAPEDVTLLTRSIRFREKTAADALTPRTQMVTMDATETVADLVSRALESGYSRFPVIGEDFDDVVGVVHVKLAFGVTPADRAQTSVSHIMGDVLAFPERRHLDELLADFRLARAYLGIVVDEHGGTAGVITLEDLMEELVGEIDDEYDSEPEPEPDVCELGEWTLSGGLHRDEVTEACGLVMPEGEFDTIAGFLLERFGRIPADGDLVEIDGWRFTVVAMDRLRIATVHVVAPPPAEPDTEVDP